MRAWGPLVMHPRPWSWGADAVLINTAMAVCDDPVRMAKAFCKAVQAGREAFEIGAVGTSRTAQPTSPLTAFLTKA